MAAAKRLNIRRSIERLLLPALESRGFVFHAKAEPDLLRPYGWFVRQGIHGQDTFEIQFNKNRLSRFCVNLRIFPTDWRPEDPDGTNWPPAYNFVHGLLLRIYFGHAKRNPSDSPTEAEYDAVVEKVVAMLPAADKFYRTRRGSWRVQRTWSGGLFTLRHLVQALVILLPFFAGVWVLGWLFRNL
jgi:hypothetical protein